jgi:dTDP-glucose 4,6-dehydratase
VTARRVLVTGGAGFIGFNFVRDLLAADPEAEVIVLDKLTYAGNLMSLAELADEPRLRFVRADIADRSIVRDLLERDAPEAIVHFAAESHVDRSIDGPAAFITTNVVGTFELLDELRAHLTRHPERKGRVRFLHVSTDEVFGALGPTGAFTETTAYAPRSPYAASKAASDHLVSAYFHTYGVPVVTTNCSNNYGPYQFPEKLIPLVIANGLAGQPLPVYGAGQNVRDWIHVSDHCAALRCVLDRGRLGETYLIGARSERKNLDVVGTICDVLDELAPRADRTSHRALITFVTDRLGHDFRYAIDPTRIETELGWRPRTSFEDGIRSTIAWYIAHRAWTDAIRSGAYRAGLP